MMRAESITDGTRRRTVKVAAATLAAIVGALAAGTAAAADESNAGARVFEHWCQPCHGEGQHHPATAALQVKYNGVKPAALQERTDLDAATIAYFVRHGAGNMAPFRKTEITDADLAALARYLSHRAP
jgi:mono/diheme cytochrome c family protein